MPLRDPEQTRARIIEMAANEMRDKGFRAASLAEIIKNAGISKGALYHHFANKQELGYSVFEEVFQLEYFEKWDSALRCDDPIQGILDMLSNIDDTLTEEMMINGCPINCISQEMSAEDEGFRLRTMRMHNLLIDKISLVLQSLKQKGSVLDNVEPMSTAAFIISSFQGMASMMKTSRDVKIVGQVNRGLRGAIEALRS